MGHSEIAYSQMTTLIQGAATWNIHLTPEQIEQFAHFQGLLLAWNDRLNLTAIREPEQVQVRHLLDSLSCEMVAGDLNGRTLIDVGTGAGFPGLPLKIRYPQLKLTLVESIQKKTRFLATVVSELGLNDVTIVAERAELLGQQAKFREQYDWVMARGVAHLPVLVEFLLPLCRVGGTVLAMKGGDVAEETAVAHTAITTLGGDPLHYQKVQLPGHMAEHTLVVIPKTRPTPDRYPRRVGIPTKRPL